MCSAPAAPRPVGTLPQCSRAGRQDSHGGHQQPPASQGMQTGEGEWHGAVLRNPQLGLPLHKLPPLEMGLKWTTLFSRMVGPAVLSTEPVVRSQARLCPSSVSFVRAPGFRKGSDGACWRCWSLQPSSSSCPQGWFISCRPERKGGVVPLDRDGARLLAVAVAVRGGLGSGGGGH